MDDNKRLFWGCFIALITTSFAFIARVFLANTWGTEFDLDPAQTGRLIGIGIWPFAVSIIGFSLFIDKIGYKVSMMFAFGGHMIWAVMGYYAWTIASADGATPDDKALAYDLVYWGSLIVALANGTVEAFINPVVATLFNKEKVKWLNILHAGWPGGLVLAGIMLIFLADMPWGYQIALIVVPALIYFVMLIPCKFPLSERVASGVSYKEMLSEFGILGAVVVGFLVTLQLMDFASDGSTKPLSDLQQYGFIGIGVAIVLGFGLYTRSLGRPLMFVLILIMMPLATTEIGTDGWITGIMEGVVKGADGAEDIFHPGWVLVYTSLIMMLLRFYAGPIAHRFSALGLLTTSAILAMLGLFSLSMASGLLLIFLAATLYGFGKTFFWPTTLGVVSEQMPKGGALTLNAISGIGMLVVGTIGAPYIGALQADKAIEAVVASDVGKTSGLVVAGKVSAIKDKTLYEIISYQAIDDDKVKEIVTNAKVRAEIDDIRSASAQGALANMVVFPAVMLVGYLLLIAYFRSRGGYRAVEITSGEDS